MPNKNKSVMQVLQSQAVFPNPSPPLHGGTCNNVSYPKETLPMKIFRDQKTKRQLVVHRDYSSTAN
jgi:hypothetical protein